ncbi:ABC transporter ATP-binding protein [Reyranella sp. CPCC 100927]|uniref:ABC transporter ATP-binding protein n=1 Tax=Reyranella sp. CPCC 100927 TaxID=2599616 RepID=UPI001C49899C|nr:ABC transporter ATP-binding protein [Reyranella sp. CPCC 100927]
MALLELQNFSCGYGEMVAVSGLSFTVETGDILALLGPNGAGKTSTILAIMGHVQIKAGTLSVDGRDVTRLPALQRTELGLAVVPEGRRLFSDLTVVENLVVGGYSRPRADEKRNLARVFDLFPRLAERRGQLAASLSGGEQQMLAIGRALMSAPRLLLVDELSLGLMPKMVDLCLDALRRLNQDERLTIVLVEQNTERALNVAQQVCVLASGRSVFAGPAEAARRDVDLLHSYTGAAS